MTDDDISNTEENLEQNVENQEEPETTEVEENEQEVEESTTEEQNNDEGFDKPVEEGDIVELEIEDLGSKGDGIARIEGFVIFIPGGEVDETYDVEITSVGSKFAFGEIAE